MKNTLQHLLGDLLHNPSHISKKVPQLRGIRSRYKTPIIGAIGCLTLLIIVFVIGGVVLLGNIVGSIGGDIPAIDATTLSGALSAIENPLQVQSGGVLIDIPYLNDLINRARPYIELFNSL